MLRGFVLALALVACSQPVAPRPAPPPQPSAEESAVLDAMDRFIRTISSNNLDDLQTQQVTGGMTFRAQRHDDGTWTIIDRPNSFWADPAHDPGVAFRARYWSPIVHVRGPVAVVWAPYMFWINGEPSHCGYDALTFIKRDGEWRISNSAWTVEPRACDALQPPDPAAMRPADQS